MTAPRLLVVSTQPWTAAPRLAMALREAGCAVEAACPPGALLARSLAPERKHRLRPWRLGRDLAAALRATRPALAVPTDDLSAALLAALHAEPDLAALVEASLGEARGYAVAGHKSAQMALAGSLGLPIPATRPVPDLAALEAALAVGTLPRVLKTDGSWGGTGVIVIRDRREAPAAFARATARPSLPAALRHAVGEGAVRPLVAWRDWQGGVPDLQDFVPGRPANRAVLADRGRVLAGLSVEVAQAASATGPASVVRVVEDAAMADTAARFVKALGLSGLLGFDFVLEEGTRRPLMIEMNPRATPICHLSRVAGGGLAGAYAAWARGGDPAAAPMPAPGTAITLFPGEWLRDPRSPHLQSGWHDVPWADPPLMRAYLDDAAAMARMDALRGLARRLTGRAPA